MNCLACKLEAVFTSVTRSDPVSTVCTQHLLANYVITNGAGGTL